MVFVGEVDGPIPVTSSLTQVVVCVCVRLSAAVGDGWASREGGGKDT